MEPAIKKVAIDYSLFDRAEKIQAVRLPASDTDKFIRSWKTFLLNRERQPNVLKDTLDNSFRLILLNDSFKNSNDIPTEIQEYIKTNPSYSVRDHIVQKSYKDFSYDEVLKTLLKSETTVIPSGFETIGTVALLNLRDKQKDQKYIIGQVILEKTPTLRTVVNKTESLHNQFRTPELEILAGVPELETVHHEGKCQFLLDVAKVYWNSRLQAERDRLLRSLKPTDVLCDMFCGIGPLTIRAAKQVGCLCLSNDLNPYCYEYLLKNVEKNKVANKMKCFNLDAAAFIREIATFPADLTPTESELKFRRFTHVYMNLPGDAVEFLFIFQGFLHFASKAIWTPETPLPIIMVNAFDEAEDEEAAAKSLGMRVKRVLNEYDHAKDFMHIQHIKDVSAHKRMFCFTFRLSRLVAEGALIKSKPVHPDEEKLKLKSGAQKQHPEETDIVKKLKEL